MPLTPSSTPPLLAPYTAPSSTRSLTVCASVLNVTSNWLLLRILSDALVPDATGFKPHRLPDEGETSSGGSRSEKVVTAERGRTVIFVSFLRSWEFWRAEARRVGLDLNRLWNEGRFAFIDGLSVLFHEDSSVEVAPSSAIQTAPTPRIVSGRSILDMTAHPVRRPDTVGAAPTIVAETGSIAANKQPKILRWAAESDNRLDKMGQEILSVIDGSTSTDADAKEHALLVLDGPDLLLAATGESAGIGAAEMNEFIMGLRERVHSAVIALAADAPLIHNAPVEITRVSTPTPLETQNAAFAVNMGHQAKTIMQLRGLDTGVAQDVTGVLRINKGGQWESDRQDPDKEFLYLVKKDGTVKVFERGERLD